MPTLKEIKGRIGSVKSTLKITSAMKLVSSAKLRKAQKAIEAMRPYEEQLQRMLLQVQGAPAAECGEFSAAIIKADAAENSSASRRLPQAIVAIASNSSLCGGFNANVIAKVREVRKAGDTVYSVGRKMADAMRKDGFASPADFTALADHPEYASAAALVEKLCEEVEAGRFTQVLLVYNHFVSTAKQVPTVDVLLATQTTEEKDSPSSASLRDPVRVNAPDGESFSSDAIIEPGRKELLSVLEPKLLKLKLYAALLDSAAAEHAARTVAMQTATDNGENLLSELTLQYNKGRQQKITAEILDLAGGQTQE